MSGFIIIKTWQKADVHVCMYNVAKVNTVPRIIFCSIGIWRLGLCFFHKPKINVLLLWLCSYRGFAAVVADVVFCKISLKIFLRDNFYDISLAYITIDSNFLLFNVLIGLFISQNFTLQFYFYFLFCYK